MYIAMQKLLQDHNKLMSDIAHLIFRLNTEVMDDEMKMTLDEQLEKMEEYEGVLFDRILEGKY